MNVSEAFALLLTGGRPDSESEVVTRPSGTTTAEGRVLLGVDRHGRRHLLIPVSPGQKASDQISRGITLAPRELVTSQGVRKFADLACQVPRLAPLFERLTEDLLERLSGTEGPLPVVAQTLEDWRDLIQKAQADLSRDTVLGIVGELEILRLLAQRSLHVMDAWTGPTGSVHDFVRNGRAIEVKATGSVDGNRVRVSNLDQLDPSTVSDLHLAVVHLGDAEDSPTIDERIAELITLGLPAIELEQSLGLLGYVRGMSASVETRYKVRSIHWWHVTDDFPGLRASDVDPTRLLGVGRVSYDLALAAAPPAMDEASVDAYLTDWIST